MPRYHQKPNGERVAFTAAEEASRDAEEALFAVAKEAEEARQYQRDREASYPEIGDQLDAVLKWADRARAQAPAVAAATTLDALKAALAPLVDLPPDLDQVVDGWLAVKARYPKPDGV